MPLIYSPADLAAALAGAVGQIMPYVGVAVVAVIAVIIGLLGIRAGIAMFRWVSGERNADMAAHYDAVGEREYRDDSW